MEIAQGDMHQPDLRIGNTLTQPVGCFHLILVQLVFARLDVDGDELVLVGRRQIRANLALDERIPASGELFFAVAALRGGHGLSRLSADPVLDICGPTIHELSSHRATGSWFAIGR
jgi:hypothetical protein